jgi:cytochrome c-type biogenesis protein CcmH/NrfF
MTTIQWTTVLWFVGLPLGLALLGGYVGATVRRRRQRQHRESQATS